MMMTIALRFIPTLLDETDRIMKAQSARGADFVTGSIIQRAKNMVPLLVPLFISAFRRADELAIAMEARCYRGGVNRTRMKELSICLLYPSDNFNWSCQTRCDEIVKSNRGKSVQGNRTSESWQPYRCYRSRCSNVL